MFTTVQGRPIAPTNLTRTFSALLRKAGLRRIRFQDLRRSTATLLLEQGVELVVIKELLGHAHIGVTAGVCGHVRFRLQRDAIDTLNGALGSPEGHRDGQRRWRRTASMRGLRPLTLPSTTAVTPCARSTNSDMNAKFAHNLHDRVINVVPLKGRLHLA